VIKEDSGRKKLTFVIQKHYASHLHYDPRLEENGLLKSWALPKEPPRDDKTKRLSVEVDDHPLGCGTFEGIIPEGEYGAGKVEIWDHGFYRTIDKSDKKWEILIEGEKLKGVYTLIRIRGRHGERQKLWLFFKNRKQDKE